MIFIILGIIAFSFTLWTTYHISHYEPSHISTTVLQKTKLDQIIDLYMKADPKDPSATIDFLMAVDACENPYEVYRKPPPPPERVVFYPPPMPSDSSTSARPRRQPKPTLMHHVMDDLARSYQMQMMYEVPTHHFGSQGDAFYKHLTKMVSSGLMSPKEAEDHFTRSYQLQRPGPRSAELSSEGPGLHAASRSDRVAPLGARRSGGG